MSPEEIEHEVEQRRASVQETLETLKERMTFRQVAEEVGQYVHADDARAALDGVAQQVRRNPAAIALIAAGLGWLAFGGRRDSEHESGDRYRWDDDADRWERRRGASGGSYPAGSADWETDSSRARSSSTSAGERLRETVSSSAGRVSDLGSGARASANRAYDRAQEGLHDAAERASQAGRSARSHISARGGHWPGGQAGIAQGVSDAIRREPLLVGAAAVGAGIALGLAFRSTSTEDRWIGPAHDSAMSAARSAASDLRARTEDAVHAGARAARDTAEEEKLVPGEDGKTIAERVENVAKAAAAEAHETFTGDKKTLGGGENLRSNR